MTYRETLPFGNTKMTESEYRHQIDQEKALKLLERSGVKDAKERMEDFIEKAPHTLSWLEDHGREHPWRYTTDPWEVYIAEILLQRTRGDAVAEVYPKFIEKFPEPMKLVNADKKEIKSSVEGLGLENRRAKTLKNVGKVLTEEFDNRVPSKSEDLRKPWRVGNYVSEATRLFSYGESAVLVDANIADFFEEILGYPMPDAPHKDEDVYELVKLLKPEKPADARAFYLAIIDREL